jgi:hypothetical protein
LHQHQDLWEETRELFINGPVDADKPVIWAIRQDRGQDSPENRQFFSSFKSVLLERFEQIEV